MATDPCPPVRVVCGVVRREDKVLVARRGPAMEHAGTWEFPGGKVEPGEDDRDALAREMLEELSLRVTVGSLVGEGTTGRVHLVAYACEAHGEPVAGEHDRLAWVPVTDLHRLAWAPADAPVIAALRAARGLP